MSSANRPPWHDGDDPDTWLRPYEPSAMDLPPGGTRGTVGLWSGDCTVNDTWRFGGHATLVFFGSLAVSSSILPDSLMYAVMLLVLLGCLAYVAAHTPQRWHHWIAASMPAVSVLLLLGT